MRTPTILAIDHSHVLSHDGALRKMRPDLFDPAAWYQTLSGPFPAQGFR